MAPGPGPDVVFRLEGAGVRYGGQWALRETGLEIRRGERVAVAGPSGAGKTTLLSLLNGSLAPSTGRVLAFGRDLADLSPGELRALQARIGAIHQQFDLVGPMKVVHNVNAGRLARWSLARSLWSLVKPQGLAEVRAALSQAGLDGKLHSRVEDLSGGEQQRVAVARALIQDPDVLLADEPVSSLDPRLSGEVMDLLRRLAVESGKTLVASLHDFGLARQHCSRILGLRGGEIVFDLAPGQIDSLTERALYEAPARR